MRAFGAMTADGAALGFSAFGSIDEAGALGLIRFGPVAAGAEPGIGTYTPCAVAFGAVASATHARLRASPYRTVEAITLSRHSSAEAPTSGARAGMQAEAPGQGGAWAVENVIGGPKPSGHCGCTNALLSAARKKIHKARGAIS